MKARIKPWLVLAVIFLAGILTGVALTIALKPYFDRPPAPGQMSTRIITKLTERLKLTDDQVTQLTPIIQDQWAKIQAIHHEEIGRVSAIMRESDDKISALLTADQKTEFQKMVVEREQKFANRSHGWDHFGAPAPDGGGGPPPPGPDSNSPPGK